MKFLFITFCIIVLSACSNSKQKVILNIDNGSGLFEKADVVFKGKKIGYISKIKIAGNKLLAEITIPKDFIVYKNTEFFITSKDILGSKLIEIINPEKPEAYNSKILDTIICKTKPTKGEMFLKEILNKTKSIMDTVFNQSGK